MWNGTLFLYLPLSEFLFELMKKKILTVVADKFKFIDSIKKNSEVIIRNLVGSWVPEIFKAH